MHEGGELGYSLSHSFGAVFDNPDLIVGCVVGDSEVRPDCARACRMRASAIRKSRLVWMARAMREYSWGSLNNRYKAAREDVCDVSPTANGLLYCAGTLASGGR